MCLNPRLFLNPISRQLTSYDCITIYNNIQHNFFSYEYLSAVVRPFTLGHYTQKECDTISEASYFIFQGVRFPLFIIAPCRKCSECLAQRSSDIRSRLLVEIADHPIYCFFTLTYDNEHLPPDGLNRKDITHFLHRLHYLLARNGLSRFFRHFVVGEYGSKTKRAHYHGLLFGLDVPLHLTHIFNDCIHKAWQKGFIQWSKPRSQRSCASYCSKYLIKQTMLSSPKGCNPMFYTSSRHGGGLGCSKLTKHYENICLSKDGSFKVLIDNNPVTVSINSAIKRALFPSLLSHYRDLLFCYRALKSVKRSIEKYSLQLVLPYASVCEKLSDFAYLNKYSESLSSTKHYELSTADWLDEALSYINMPLESITYHIDALISVFDNTDMSFDLFLCYVTSKQKFMYNFRQTLIALRSNPNYYDSRLSKSLNLLNNVKNRCNFDE